MVNKKLYLRPFHTWHLLNQAIVNLNCNKKESSLKPTRSRRKNLLQDGKELRSKISNRQEQMFKIMENMTNHLNYLILEDQYLKVSTMMRKNP